ncbi:MAG: hypothetical protein HQL78_13475 [Magnetococcales bacterium]|nr:hypothetical protein [Magnetococcales bacterium]
MMYSFFLRILLACAVLHVLLTGCVTTPKGGGDLPELVFPSPPDQARFAYERSIFSSADSQPKESTATSELKSMLAGKSEVSGEVLGKPYGVAVYKGVVFVSDTVHRSVMRFDPARGLYSEIGKKETGTLMKPMGLSVDAKGNLYVMDSTSKRIMVYTNEGDFLRSIGKREEFEHPSSVAVNPEGTRVFAVDTAGPRSKPEFHRIRVYDGINGNFLYDIGRRGDGDGEFNLLRDATIGKDGLLYVVDGGNFRIQVFKQDGTFVKKFGEVGRHLGQFARPKGIATDSQNNLYVSDASHGNFQIFNKDGQLLLFVGDRGKETERAKYLLPAMITVDEDGRVYIVDQGYHKVDIYRPISLNTKDGFLGKAYETLSKMRPSKTPKDAANPEKAAKETANPDKAATKETANPDKAAKETANPEKAATKETANPEKAATKETANPEKAANSKDAATSPAGSGQSANPKPSAATPAAQSPAASPPAQAPAAPKASSSSEATQPAVSSAPQLPAPNLQVSDSEKPAEGNNSGVQLRKDAKMKRLGQP